MDPFARWLAVERFTGLSAQEVHAGNALLDGIRSWLLGAVELQKGDTVLELGCGQGEFLPHLLDAVGPTGTVLAVDRSPALCSAAAATLGRHPWGGRGHVVEGDIRQLPYDCRSMDAVVCRSVLQYTEDGLPDAAREIARVLRPHGRFAAFEMLSADGAPRLPVPRTDAQHRVHDEAVARWRRLPWGLTRTALAGAFETPMFRPVTLSAVMTQWRRPYSCGDFARYLQQVPRPGCPTLHEVYTAGLSPDLRQDWDALLADATETLQRGSWAYLTARRTLRA